MYSFGSKTLREQLELWKQGDKDIIKVAWYDWFCNESSLERKGEALFKKLSMIVESKKLNLDLDNCYVWFKNNCPGFGDLYDDFRIADISTNETIVCITPRSGHTSDNGNGDIFFVNHPDYPFGVAFEGKWKDIKKWLMEYN